MSKMNQQSKGQSFREIYEGISKQEFVRRIASVTCKSESTVYNWTSGRFKPDALSQSVISKELGVPVEILFPQKEEACV